MGSDARLSGLRIFEVSSGGDSLKVGFPMPEESGEFMGDNEKREFP